MVPPLCCRTHTPCFLPNGIFGWSRQIPKLPKLPWNWSVIIQSPLFEYDVCFKHWGGQGIPGSHPNSNHKEWCSAYYQKKKKKWNHVSAPFMTGRVKCFSENNLTLPAVCFVIQKQFFRAKWLSVVHLPCFLQAAVVLLLCPVKSLIILLSG